MAKKRHISKILPQLLPRPITFSSPSQALESVKSKDGLGVYASSDVLFKGAVFGRDSLEVGEDLLFTRPRLVKRILLELAKLQGERLNTSNEEEPGKIIHEYRRSVVDGEPLDEGSKQIFNKLSKHWGGDGETLIYYGSVDATPLFIRLACRYFEAYGDRFLFEKVNLRSGHDLLMINVLNNALDWLESKLKGSKSGLLEFKRLNPLGLENQVWKDSREFYIHEDGSLANHNAPIASIEVQAVVYDALRSAAGYFPNRADELSGLAQSVQTAVLDLWVAGRSYFALGIDYGLDNKPRVISTMTANPAELLDSRLFDNLPDELRAGYISGIVRNILGTDFLTDAGIRSRALSEAGLVAFWDYHGSYTSWPKETYDIAKGLKRQGFPRLAKELENRILNVVNAVRAYPEFIYVDYRGRVLGMSGSPRSHGEMVSVEGTNQPEKIQAWTVSAVLAINAERRLIRRPFKPKPKVVQQSWQSELEKEVLRHIPTVKLMRSAKELNARYPFYPYELDGHR